MGEREGERGGERGEERGEERGRERERERRREREGREGEREGGERGGERENLFLLTAFFGPYNLIMGEIFSSSILPTSRSWLITVPNNIHEKITQFGLVKINAVFR